MKVPDIINGMNVELQELEESLYNHPYQALEADYEIVDGQKVYTKEFLDNMPIEYNTMLTRFGTLLELKERLQESQIENVFKTNLENHLKENYSPKYHNRWEINFDE